MTPSDWFIKAATCAVYAQAFEKLGDFYHSYIARQLAIYYTAEGVRSLAGLGAVIQDTIKKTSPTQ